MNRPIKIRDIRKIAAAVILPVALASAPSQGTAQSSNETQTAGVTPPGTTKAQLYTYAGTIPPMRGYLIVTAEKPDAPNFHSCDNRQVTVDTQKLIKTEGDCLNQRGPGPWLWVIKNMTPDGVRIATEAGREWTLNSANWNALVANSQDGNMTRTALNIGDWVALYRPAGSNMEKLVKLRPNEM
jgi:hypothetical protein